MRTLPSDDDYADAERAYSRAKWKLIFHCLFVGACCVPAVLMRRFFRMPPALLGVVFIVALIVFGGDIMNFIRCRDRLKRLQVDN